MAETNPLSRQPSSLDYLSPTQFAFNILQLPKVQFNTVSVNIPDISLGESVIPTPFKDIPIQGTSLTYGNLDITFIVDEELDNYREIHGWLTGIGFPQTRGQFSIFRNSTSVTPSDARNIPVDRVGSAVPDRAMFSDATLTVLSNKNNPIIEVRFEDVFPVSVGALSFTQTATDVEYLTTEVSFRYKIYTINKI
tara:strand:+ start:157 stop:738 length:582 start_codon:yes stop_codon:yes gene_type:complete